MTYKMKKAFDDAEKALLADKKFNHEILRKIGRVPRYGKSVSISIWCCSATT